VIILKISRKTGEKKGVAKLALEKTEQWPGSMSLG
jgi:hypothetical protein